MTILGLQRAISCPRILRIPASMDFTFPIHQKVLILSRNVPKPSTLSENQLLKQRRKRTGRYQVFHRFKIECCGALSFSSTINAIKILRISFHMTYSQMVYHLSNLGLCLSHYFVILYMLSLFL